MEKAARGVDGRFYPWGDFLDPSWCRMHESARGREVGDFGPVVVDSYPVDVSPYGVRGLGGNVHDWCAEVNDKTGVSLVADNRVVAPEYSTNTDSRASRAIRGGAWISIARPARSASRHQGEAGYRHSYRGFRGLLRPVPPGRPDELASRQVHEVYRSGGPNVPHLKSWIEAQLRPRWHGAPR